MANATPVLFEGGSKQKVTSSCIWKVIIVKKNIFPPEWRHSCLTVVVWVSSVNYQTCLRNWYEKMLGKVVSLWHSYVKPSNSNAMAFWGIVSSTSDTILGSILLTKLKNCCKREKSKSSPFSPDFASFYQNWSKHLSGTRHSSDSDVKTSQFK